MLFLRTMGRPRVADPDLRTILHTLKGQESLPELIL